MSSSVRATLLREAHLAAWLNDDENEHSSSSSSLDASRYIQSSSSSSNNALLTHDTPMPLVYLPRLLHGAGAIGGGSDLSSVLTVGHSSAEFRRDDANAVLDAAARVGGNNASVNNTAASQPDDSEKLWSVLTNYLSLGQYELSRQSIESLFIASPERVIRALRDIVYTNIPSAWLFSRGVPSAGHLSWLAYVEYKKLYRRVYPERDGMNSENQEEEEKERKMRQMIIGEDGSNTKKSTSSTAASSAGASFRSQLPSSSNTPINPYGFLTHDRLTLTVIEYDSGIRTTGSNSSPSSSAPGSNFLTFGGSTQHLQSRIKLHDQYLFSQKVPVSGGGNASSANSVVTTLKHTFHTTVFYADSNLWIKIYGSSGSQQAGSKPDDTCIGEVSLPLHQIRQKMKYHIWLPLHVPSSGDSGATPSAHSGGRVRVKCVWWASGLVPAGDFSLRTRHFLETDLLIANAVVNHRLHPSKKLLTPEIVEEMRNYVRDAWTVCVNKQKLLTKKNMIKRYGGFIQPNKNELIEDLLVKQDFDTAQWRSEMEYNGEDGSNDGSGIDTSTGDDLQLSDPVYRHLYRLIRTLPSIGHSLSSHLCLLSSPDEKYMFQNLYTQLLGEMIQRKEYARAMETMGEVCQSVFVDVETTTKKKFNHNDLNGVGQSQQQEENVQLRVDFSGTDVEGVWKEVLLGSGSSSKVLSAAASAMVSPSLAMLDSLLLLFIVYIHHGASPVLDRHAQNLMKNRIGGLMNPASGNVSAKETPAGKERSLAGVNSVGQDSAPSSKRATRLASQPILIDTPFTSSSDDGKELEYQSSSSSSSSSSASVLSFSSDEQAHTHFAHVLDRKTKVYTALIGGACLMEHELMRKLVPGVRRNDSQQQQQQQSAQASILRRFVHLEELYVSLLLIKRGSPFPVFFSDLLGTTWTKEETKKALLEGGGVVRPPIKSVSAAGPVSKSVVPPAQAQVNSAPSSKAASVKVVSGASDSAVVSTGKGATPAATSSSAVPTATSTPTPFPVDDEPAQQPPPPPRRLPSLVSADTESSSFLPVVPANILGEFLLVDHPTEDAQIWLHAFWRYYSHYIRTYNGITTETIDPSGKQIVLQNQLLDFPLYVLLETVDAGQWNKVNSLLTYFPKLRLILLVLTWSKYSLSYSKRREIILRLWRSQRSKIMKGVKRRLKLEEEYANNGKDDKEVVKILRVEEGGKESKSVAHASPADDDTSLYVGGDDENASSSSSSSTSIHESHFLTRCDRYDMYILWIDTLVSLHPALSSLTRVEQEVKSTLFLTELLESGSFLSAFREYLPTLAQPEPLLQLLNPYNSGGIVMEGEEEDDGHHGGKNDHTSTSSSSATAKHTSSVHDYNILRTYYSVRIVLDKIKEDKKSGRRHPHPEQKTDGLEFKDDSDEEEEEKKSSSSSSTSFAQLSLLKQHIFSLTTSSYQITLLEQLYEMLFITQSEWGGYEHSLEVKLAEALNGSGKKNGGSSSHLTLPQVPSNSNLSSSHFYLSPVTLLELLTFFKDSLNELMSSIEEDEKNAESNGTNNTRIRKAKESAASSSPVGVTSSTTVHLKLYPTSSILTRFFSLQNKLVESIWRIHVVTKSMKLVELDGHPKELSEVEEDVERKQDAGASGEKHVVSSSSSSSLSTSYLLTSLSSISLYFLSHDENIDSSLNTPFSQLDHITGQCSTFLSTHISSRRLVEDTLRWKVFVQNISEAERSAEERERIVKRIREGIEAYYGNKVNTSGTPSSTPSAPPMSSLNLRELLQTYFLNFDSALTFAYLLTESEYQSFLKEGMKYLRECLVRIEKAGGGVVSQKEEVKEEVEEEDETEGHEYSLTIHEQHGEDGEEHSIQGDIQTNNSSQSVDDEQDETISAELIQFYIHYTELLMKNSTAVSTSSAAGKKRSRYHDLSLDDTMFESSGLDATDRPYGYSARSDIGSVRWMNALKTAAEDGPGAGEFASYMKQYHDYMKLVQPVVGGSGSGAGDATTGTLVHPFSHALGVKVIQYLLSQSKSTRDRHDQNYPGYNPYVHLSLQVLPTLAAIRYVMRNVNRAGLAVLDEGKSEENDGKEKTETELLRSSLTSSSASSTTEYTKLTQLILNNTSFNPTYSSWVQWRLKLHEFLYQMIQQSVTVPFVFLNVSAASNDHDDPSSSIHTLEDFLSYAHSLLQQENTSSDQALLFALCRIYVDTFESIDEILRREKKEQESKSNSDGNAKSSSSSAQPPPADRYRSFIYSIKLSLLSICDTYLDHPSSSASIELVDRLLITIIQDECCTSELRIDLLLRLNDIVYVSVCTLRFISEWNGKEDQQQSRCLNLLLKCLAGLSTIELTEGVIQVGKKGVKGKKKSRRGGAKKKQGIASSKRGIHEFDHRYRFDEDGGAADDDDGDVSGSSGSDGDNGQSGTPSDDDEDDEDGAVDAGVSGRSGIDRAKSSVPRAISKKRAEDDEDDSHETLFTGSIAELRSSIEFKYHIILIYKQLSELTEKAKSRESLNGTNTSGASTSAVSSFTSGTATPSPFSDGNNNSNASSSSTHPSYPTWQSLELACNSDLTHVLLSLLAYNAVYITVSHKLYVLYKTYSALYPRHVANASSGAAAMVGLDSSSSSPSTSADELQQQQDAETRLDVYLQNQLESAEIAALLTSSNAVTGYSASTSERILAMKKLQGITSLPRLLSVTESLLTYLDSSHSRHVVMCLVGQTLKKWQEREVMVNGGKIAEVEEENEKEEKKEKSQSGKIQAKSSRPPIEEEKSTVTHSTSSSTSTPSLPFRSFPSLLTPTQELWYLKAYHGSRILVHLPESLLVQGGYAQYYQDPYAVITGLLKSGDITSLTKVFPLFRTYCESTAHSDDAFFYILNFASRLLTFGMEELVVGGGGGTGTATGNTTGDATPAYPRASITAYSSTSQQQQGSASLDKEFSFSLMSLCLHHNEHSKVGKMCLIIVEILSHKLLASSIQPYMILQSCTLILMWMGRYVVPTLQTLNSSSSNHPDTALLTEILNTYELYVKLCCGTNVDTKTPMYDVNPGAGGQRVNPLSAAAAANQPASHKKNEDDSKSFPSPAQHELLTRSIESLQQSEIKQIEETLPLLSAFVLTALIPTLGGKSDSVVPPSPSSSSSASSTTSSLTRLFGSTFSIKDFTSPEKVISIRDALVANEKKLLAKRVWKECGHKAGVDFDRIAIASRMKSVQRA